MTEQQVLYETDGKVGIVTLNRPNKLNALSMDLLYGTHAARGR
jgi:enoyl-CoA hydratase/carnithine racemase